MKIAALMVVAAALLPLSAKADGPVKVSDFPLADRIKEKVASGKPLDIYVSYHDVSNEFAPSIKAGVAKGAADDKVNAQFIGPVGSDANAQINEIETLMGKMDGLAISSVSSDALGPVTTAFSRPAFPSSPTTPTIRTANAWPSPGRISSSPDVKPASSWARCSTARAR